jgi:hypothetical protein
MTENHKRIFELANTAKSKELRSSFNKRSNFVRPFNRGRGRGRFPGYNNYKYN